MRRTRTPPSRVLAFDKETVMNLSRCSLLALTTSLALALGAPSAALAARHAKRRSQRYEVQTSESSIKAGAARIVVRAPLATVERVVTDFGHYPRFIKHFKRAKVLGHSRRNTDVYLEVPILHGAAKLWAILRFSPPKWVNGEEDVEAHMLRGNVKRMDAKWRLARIDDSDTELSLEMLIVPSAPMPRSFVTHEVAYAADQAVAGSCRHAERLAAASRKH
jgi:ribosome-associated toxin RatA of RatAB toxin-antitoxin module